MNDEKQKVLQMLSQGAITPEEAERLLEALDAGRQEETREPVTDANLQGKKLRVEVKGDTSEHKKMNVNVSVPLVLARHIDNIIAVCMPDAATKELKEQGIDIKGLNFNKIVDTFESLDEDIVNADIGEDDAQLKVRVYVE